ncbi:hypothetical protein HMPREF0663_12302 [Hoylesella oralis ATCC 33269]|uniref:Uncharacterized protein n=1 Tax=Hoylesella oralis ATCC 33269 TaxID=873533 RepID=E7RSN4_9BACT|nr:hypothetical protein HMPREF0663_12302 [Hoylesella oralis ATCC 33269]
MKGSCHFYSFLRVYFLEIIRIAFIISLSTSHIRLIFPVIFDG